MFCCLVQLCSEEHGSYCLHLETIECWYLARLRLAGGAKVLQCIALAFAVWYMHCLLQRRLTYMWRLHARQHTGSTVRVETPPTQDGLGVYASLQLWANARCVAGVLLGCCILILHIPRYATGNIRTTATNSNVWQWHIPWSVLGSPHSLANPSISCLACFDPLQYPQPAHLPAPVRKRHHMSCARCQSAPCCSRQVKDREPSTCYDTPIMGADVQACAVAALLGKS